MLLQDLLNAHREPSRCEREKGDYFERLVRVFLASDGWKLKDYEQKINEAIYKQSL